MDPRTFTLAHDTARQRCAYWVLHEAPDGWVVRGSPPSRTLDQNAKFHAICSDLRGLPWYGKARNADDWKTLLVSGHTVATGGMAEVIPGLEREFVNIRESTARMSKARGSSLIEYSLAFCVTQDLPTRKAAQKVLVMA